MDNETEELIYLLGTRIGMIMQDAGEIALSLGKISPIERAEAIGMLDGVSNSISALVAAIRNLAI